MTTLKITCDGCEIGEIKTPFFNLPQNALHKYLKDWYINRNPNNETPLNYYKIKEIK